MLGGSMRYGFLFAASVLASSLACGTADAQDATPPVTPATPSAGAASESQWLPRGCPPSGAASERRREAGRLFAAGERASTALNVGAAAQSFACSYVLVATAQAAYNAGVAYEGLDEPERARYWFQRYLEQAPAAEDRADVNQRIAVLDVQIGEREASAQAAREAEARLVGAEAAALAAAAARAETEAREAAEQAERAERERAEAARPQGLGVTGVTGIVVGGAGVAAGITGLVLYVMAGGVHDDFVDGLRMDTALANRGETLDLAASSLWIAGGALVLGGVGLILFDVLGSSTERAPASARLAPYFTPRAGDGGELGLAGVF